MRNLQNLVVLAGLAVMTSCSGKSTSDRGEASAEDGTSDGEANVDVAQGRLPGAVTGRNLLDVRVIAKCATAACLDVTLHGQLRYTDKSTAIVTAANATKLGVKSLTFDISPAANATRTDVDPFTPRLESYDGNRFPIKAGMKAVFLDGTTKAGTIDQAAGDLGPDSGKALYMFFSQDTLDGKMGTNPGDNFLGASAADYKCAHQGAAAVQNFNPGNAKDLVWFAGVEDFATPMNTRLSGFGLPALFLNDDFASAGQSGVNIAIARAVRVVSQLSSNKIDDRQIAPANTNLMDLLKGLSPMDARDTSLARVQDVKPAIWWYQGCDNWRSIGSSATGHAIQINFDVAAGQPGRLMGSSATSCVAKFRLLCFAAER